MKPAVVGAGCVLLEHTVQLARVLRPSNWAVNDLFVVEGTSVNVLIVMYILAQGGSLQRDACESAAGSRPRKHFRSQGEVGLGCSRSADGTARDFTLAAEREFVRKQAVRTLPVHDEQDEVRFNQTNLKADVSGFNTHGCGGGPIDTFSAREEAFAIFSANTESAAL